MKKNPHAQALGAIGGKSTSDAKKNAARENGKKGGRPRLKTFCHTHKDYDECKGWVRFGFQSKEEYDEAQKKALPLI